MTVTPVRSTTGLEGLIAWLDQTPLKYEIVDGAIVVSPSPTVRHNDSTGQLYAQLLAAGPPELLVAWEYGWRYDLLEPVRYLEPDIAVVPREGLDLDASLHDEVPLLVVETRSPSTWRFDEGIKKDLYAEGGVQSYWLLDPSGPGLRVLTLQAGRYVEEQVLEGPGELTVTLPFPMTIRLD